MEKNFKPVFFLRFAVEKLPLQNGHNWYSIWFQTTRQARAPPRRRQSTATTSKNALKSSSSPFFSSVYLIFLDWKEINIDRVQVPFEFRKMLSVVYKCPNESITTCTSI